MFWVHHSHRIRARKPRFDWDLYSVIVQGPRDLEHSQHLGHNRPDGRICKMSPNADASTESERDMFNVVGFEGTIVVEESLGYERMWVGVPRFVVSHRPDKTDHSNHV